MSEPIGIDDFKKVEIKIGEIKSAEKIEGSDKLLKLVVDFGDPTGGASPDNRDVRQVLSGIAAYFPNPEELVGKRCPFVTNLAPRMMMGLESQAMILATGGDNETPFALFETAGSPGAQVR
ncbi:MAG: methionyl-tRNA synthetase [Parcubacteria group bacterium Gr01-1014_56]|nr:MAG: methionyl-tRNA synthetase [Parcubacteria group bacterium Gr01-1014_56]